MYQPHPGTVQMPEPQRPPAPAPVRNAVRVMYAGAAASLSYALVFIATLNSTDFALQRAIPGRVNDAQHFVLVPAALIEGVIGACLWIFIALACRRRRNWARITGTVFFGLATLDVLGNLTAPQAALAKVFGVVVWLLGLAAVVLLWRGPSSAFFHGRQS
jgi:hypothetical protein